MGASFDKNFIMKKSPFVYESWIRKAAKDIGYVPGPEGKGVPLCIAPCGENPEWFVLDSPLLEAEGAGEKLLCALSREFKAPALRLSCCDSDFALCRLIDTAKGTETAACINEPYEDIGLPEAKPSLWAGACKKRWKCRENQFEEIFSGRYVFAEDGLNKLAELLRLPAEALDPEGTCADQEGANEFWLMPEAEFTAAPIPVTLTERLASYIDKTFADKLTRLGYRRFGGSSLRWHKVFGEEGKEIVSSIVFAVRYGWDINIFYGSQAVCCPLVLSDKYFPMHDHLTYLYEALYEYPKRKGYNPMFGKAGSMDTFDPVNEPEKIFPYMDEFVLKQLETVKDIPSLRAFVKSTDDYDMFTHGRFYSYGFAYRMLVEAILETDEKTARKAADKIIKRYGEILECAPSDRKGAAAQEITELPSLFLEKGIPACLEALKKVRDSNMRRLKKGGII
ncbi:MAG: hypothetical protein K6G56_01590 [Clostridiales bacterium]|nr:hypothetical protein [Clostridiales bacterium]